MKLYFNIYLSITFPIATLVCIFYDFTKGKGLLISVLSGFRWGSLRKLNIRAGAVFC